MESENRSTWYLGKGLHDIWLQICIWMVLVSGYSSTVNGNWV
jgi:hypothetical protein